MLRWIGMVVCCGALLALAGCQKPPPKPVPVNGTVTLDGAPLAEGDVLLLNSAGLAPDTLPVKGGAFQGMAKPGKVRVEIRSYRPAKPPTTPIPQESTPGPENYLPARYNTESTLTAEVTASGLNPSQFDLKSK